MAEVPRARDQVSGKAAASSAGQSGFLGPQRRADRALGARRLCLHCKVIPLDCGENTSCPSAVAERAASWHREGRRRWDVSRAHRSSGLLLS